MQNAFPVAPSVSKKIFLRALVRDLSQLIATAGITEGNFGNYYLAFGCQADSPEAVQQCITILRLAGGYSGIGVLWLHLLGKYFFSHPVLYSNRSAKKIRGVLRELIDIAGINVFYVMLIAFLDTVIATGNVWNAGAKEIEISDGNFYAQMVLMGLLSIISNRAFRDALRRDVGKVATHPFLQRSWPLRVRNFLVTIIDPLLFEGLLETLRGFASGRGFMEEIQKFSDILFPTLQIFPSLVGRKWRLGVGMTIGGMLGILAGSDQYLRNAGVIDQRPVQEWVYTTLQDELVQANRQLMPLQKTPRRQRLEAFYGQVNFGRTLFSLAAFFLLFITNILQNEPFHRNIQLTLLAVGISAFFILQIWRCMRCPQQLEDELFAVDQQATNTSTPGRAQLATTIEEYSEEILTDVSSSEEKYEEKAEISSLLTVRHFPLHVNTRENNLMIQEQSSSSWGRTGIPFFNSNNEQSHSLLRSDPVPTDSNRNREEKPRCFVS